MNGVKPNKANQRRFEIIREIGCIICRIRRNTYTPPQIHHIEGCKTQDAHTKTLGLCELDHMGEQLYGPSPDYVSRHPNKKRFEAAHGNEYDLLKLQDELIAEYGN